MIARTFSNDLDLDNVPLIEEEDVVKMFSPSLNKQNYFEQCIGIFKLIDNNCCVWSCLYRGWWIFGK